MTNANKTPAAKVSTLQVGETIQGVGLFIKGTITELGEVRTVYRKPGVQFRMVTCQTRPGSWTTTAVADGEFARVPA